MKTKYIIGIDEVGRGALAGPVVVCAVALNKKILIPIKKEFPKIKLKDSKKLTQSQRENWLKIIKKKKISYSISSISPKIIDEINISNAANLAATRSCKKLINSHKLPIVNCEIMLDGGLYIKNLKIKNLKQKTIIKGDEKIPAISLASIVAKIYRDKLMKKLHKKYPQYDFSNNVGYGTKKHLRAIEKFGKSKVHRKSFKIK